ncbi:MAG: ABC transporter ATP-binding protein [Vallitaleaceae bacterium]|jgi:ATP-binding cassette subfamily B multidrug efflux pump|nr:ABC transporter ATP-binding protein [Vallitaleaceae bacterium]
MTKKRNTFGEDELLDQEFNATQLKKLLKYLFAYSKEVGLALVVILISAVANLVTPLLLRYVIDDFIPNHNISGLIIASLGFIGIIIISTISMKYRIRFMSRLGQNVIRDIRHDLFAHIQTLPFTFFDSRPHGKILVRVVNYVNALSEVLSNGFINLIVDIFSFAMALIIMLTMSLPLTFTVLAFVPFAFAGITYVKNKQRKSMQEVSAKQSNMNAYIHESISGIKVTQSFTREDVNLKVFEELMDDYQDKWMESRRYIALIFPIVKNISIMSQGTMLVVALVLLKGQITAGVVVASLAYIGNFWMPLINISEFYNQLVSASAYLERIFETIDIKAEITNTKDAYDLPEVKGQITFDHVTFGYEKDHVILNDFCLDVQAGETIAFVGPTGAGKTTVVNLISRFYDVNTGAIRIDGHDIRDVTLHSLRGQLGIMMQDTFIFSGTIIDNIRYGRLDASDEEVIAAAKTVKAHDFIMDMAEDYHTEVNERGTRLSTGQRQLLSFARALLKDPKVLILDEATSSIDTQTEKAIQEGLDLLLTGRTSFVIAHRLSTIKKANRIIVINNKGIEEMGTHDELMENKGHYYELYQAQVKFLQEVG